jgi:pyruvate/2-oxoglutarate dehydrogenase complex dihydrolipoamide dehydrogenase (E3) component/uncharacterized membrane protein YdjX (TVP38/TMEM64 family)
MQNDADLQPTAPLPEPSLWRRQALPIAVLLVMAAAYALGLHRYLSLRAIVENRAALETFTAQNRLLALVAFMAIYVAAVALSFPGASVLTVLGGLLFGWIVAGLAIIFSATLGAVVIFLVVKTALGGALVRKAGPRLVRVSAGFNEDALSYLLFLRLVPLFPFWLVNIAAGMANIPLRSFILATFIGIIPATFTFAYLGEGLDSILVAQSASHAACVAAMGEAACPFELSLSSLFTAKLLAAFVALGVLALLPVARPRMNYDLAIIGGGSAGLSVAASAAQLGQRVVLFEKGDMGGECLNAGCIPSKALLAAARAAQAHRTSAPFGVSADEPDINFTKVMDHVDGVIAGIAPHDSQARFEGLGVKVVRAHASFAGRNMLVANGEEFTARRMVIATGSRPFVPAIPGLAEVPYFTNETIFRNRTLPQHLVIIGCGPVGLEMAQAFRRLGSAVTVLEIAAPLGKEDPELANVVLDQLRSERIAIHGTARVTRVQESGSAILLHFDDMPPITGSHLLVAAGRVPNLDRLQLQDGGIEFDERGIKIDHTLRSISNRHVYVAGDAAAGLQFTHVAGYHAGLIIRSGLFRLPVRNRTDIIPRVTFTDPELAHVGLSEAEARKIHGVSVTVFRWQLGENDRALAEGAAAGSVKIVALKNGRIVGASIVAPGAGEMIAMWVLAVSRKLKVSAIADLVLPYPTRSEAGKRAVMSHYAELASKPYVRGLIAFLKKFG